MQTPFFVKVTFFSFPLPTPRPPNPKAEHHLIQTVIQVSLQYFVRIMDFDFFCLKYVVLFR